MSSEGFNERRAMAQRNLVGANGFTESSSTGCWADTRVETQVSCEHVRAVFLLVFDSLDVMRLFSVSMQYTTVGGQVQGKA